MPIALAVHGGAWNIPDDAVDAHCGGVADVLRAGWDALRDGASAIDVVESAVRALESDPTFDAGRGARLNRAREVELDASIMDGRTLGAGAVGAVRGVPHPITLARRVMEHGEHVLLVGRGAKSFARSEGVPTCRTRDLLVGRELERYERVRRGDRDLVEYEFREGPKGTVGAVALDRSGHVAAATSTGGVQDKHAGRLGDSAVPGAGTYADDRRGAASCTGVGEAILRVVLAKAAVDALDGGREPGAAARRALRGLDRVEGLGGLILVDRAGRLGAAFNTPRMARGLATGDGLRVGIERRTRLL